MLRLAGYRDELLHMPMTGSGRARTGRVVADEPCRQRARTCGDERRTGAWRQYVEENRLGTVYAARDGIQARHRSRHRARAGCGLREPCTVEAIGDGRRLLAWGAGSCGRGDLTRRRLRGGRGEGLRLARRRHEDGGRINLGLRLATDITEGNTALLEQTSWRRSRSAARAWRSRDLRVTRRVLDRNYAPDSAMDVR